MASLTNQICSEKAADTKRTREKLQAKNIEWRRPSDFLETPQLFENGTDANDLRQGSLGDCWCIASMAALSEANAQQIIEGMFLDKKTNNAGVYAVYMNVSGNWETIFVDDFIPCHPRGGPIFARAHGSEFWACILEKAYAKIYNGYGNLAGGHEVHAMMDFSGYPSFYLPVGGYRDSKHNMDETWSQLLTFTKNGLPMTCGTPGERSWKGKGINPNKAKYTAGVYYGHAYTLLGAKEATVDGKNLKLVNVRNPWGSGEWKGNFSDHDVEGWTVEAKKAFNPVFAQDGAFWMPYEELWKYYNEVTVLMSKSTVGKFWSCQLSDRFESKEGQEIVLHGRELSVKHDCEIIVSGYQPDKRNPEHPAYGRMLVVVAKADSHKIVMASKKSWNGNKRCVPAHHPRLPAGDYIMCISCVIQPDEVTVSEAGIENVNGKYLLRPSYFRSFVNSKSSKYHLKLNSYTNGTEKWEISKSSDSLYQSKSYGIYGGAPTRSHKWEVRGGQKPLPVCKVGRIPPRKFGYMVTASTRCKLGEPLNDEVLKKVLYKTAKYKDESPLMKISSNV